MKVKVAAIQMSADIGGREANVERAERLLIQAARQGADLCVLPELALDEFFPLYIPSPGATSASIVSISKRTFKKSK